jgi:hypothetical protein
MTVSETPTAIAMSRIDSPAAHICRIAAICSSVSLSFGCPIPNLLHWLVVEEIAVFASADVGVPIGNGQWSDALHDDNGGDYGASVAASRRHGCLATYGLRGGGMADRGVASISVSEA